MKPIRIKELRDMMNLSRKEFADLVGVTQSSLSLYERGEVTPSAEVLLKIAQNCNVSLDWLCDNRNNVSDPLTLSFYLLKLLRSPTYKIQADRDDTNAHIKIDFSQFTLLDLHIESAESSDAEIILQLIDEFNERLKAMDSMTDAKYREEYYAFWEAKLFQELLRIVSSRNDR